MTKGKLIPVVIFFSGKLRKRDIVGNDTSMVKDIIAKDNDTLYLIVVKEVWDRIVSGDKTIEYRERTDYWDKRINARHYDYVKITNGYGNDTRPYRLYRYTGAEEVMKDSIECYAIQINSNLMVESRDKINEEVLIHWHLDI